MLQRRLLTIRYVNLKRNRRIVKQILPIVMKLSFQINNKIIFRRQFSMPFQMIDHILWLYVHVLSLNIDILIVQTWYFNKVTLNGKRCPLKVNTQWTDGSHALICYHVSSDKFLEGFVIFEATSRSVGDVLLCWCWLSHVEVSVIFPVLVSI